jgi:hypothetical protein
MGQRKIKRAAQICSFWLDEEFNKEILFLIDFANNKVFKVISKKCNVYFFEYKKVNSSNNILSLPL